MSINLPCFNGGCRDYGFIQAVEWLIFVIGDLLAFSIEVLNIKRIILRSQATKALLKIMK